jgi:CRISPR/Cas system-associated exonuclease Cas4 (RecB family)
MSSFRRIPPGDEFPVSATLYVTYLKCPQQALARLQGVYPVPSVAAFRGSLAHRIFARHLVDGPIAAEDFSLTCRQEAGTHFGGMMASLAMKPSEFRGMTDEIEQLYDRFKQVPTDGFEGAEVQVESEPVPGITLRGRVDAVFGDDDGTRIVDWKTGSYLDDSEPQLDFYAMAWRAANGSLPVAMEAVSLRTGEKRVSVPTEEGVARTEESVAAMIGELRSAIHDRSELTRSAGPYCRWCPLLDDCAEGTGALKILSN